ncbi:uncharacterized protein DUF4191 [Propionicimonas paludicola]|uniref:Uncharacterized protein DUF4191 n=1 Tax=Propionicimonas paludicola TaxID=185243 RepID=A0A2A9CTD4_9ACTN|nr:DUF4191 domain-containing protein [Propionicimonas paludicola]PFG17628.1 uncharacterized protein DUF4191 [Propionicimonas paludicola]
MASEKAKELAAKQKAEVKAAKLAKKNSTNPRDWPWYKQLWQTYKVTAEVDPKLNWYLAGTFVGVLLVATVIGFFAPPMWVWALLGTTGGLTVDLYVLTDRAKKATFVRFAGQPGSAEVALNLLNSKAWSYTIGITATRQLDLVHRVVGPAGIILIGEGAPARTRQLLTTEAKKHEQIAYDAKVITIMMGDADNQVPLAKLTGHIKKLPKALSKTQIADITSRLRALDAARPKAPIPRGPLPNMKGLNRAMRGR